MQADLRKQDCLLPGVNTNARGLDVIIQIIYIGTNHMSVPGVNEIVL